MDENVMRVLQMLQDGKISSQEAETLIAALRGESPPEAGGAGPTEKAADAKEDKTLFEKIKPPKLDFDNLGERISSTVSKIQPDKIVQRLQSQLRSATRAGVHLGSTVAARVRTWTEGDDVRPENRNNLPEHTETQQQDFHLEPGAFVGIENPLGNVTVTGSVEGPASVTIKKVVWAARNEDLVSTLGKIEVTLHGTDARLDVKIGVPEGFHEGTVDIEVRVPRSVKARVSTHFGNVEITQLDGLAEGVTTTGTLKFSDLGGDAHGETASGDIYLARVEGTGTVATQSGDIFAEDIHKGISANAASGDVKALRVEGGRVECKSVSGDVSVQDAGQDAPLDIVVESISGDTSLVNAGGSVNMKAVSGDVEVKNIAATRLQAQTVSGDVSVSLRDAFSGTLQVNTVSGDVSLVLPEGSNVRVSLSTTSGELRSDYEAQNVMGTGTMWTGQIGTGAGTLNVQTISGDTHIKKA